ncbi:MAG TPA: CaiB/BaiF CoA-transferase family protein [Candidatus Acidoferrum sp.]|nr:CaiB/BaiF CoA-transferase family protein [Candidatus Acidoferrum sp.]
MSAKNILDDVRVVELSEALAGPYCAMLLGDFGADVIKIERPGVGDQSRGWGPPFVGSESAYFLGANRNKRSVALNYDHLQGAEALRKLISASDIFICNQPSLASLKKRGINAETLREKNPRLIYCSITGYGFTGPKAGRPGYDILAQAEAGVMSFTGEPDGSPMRYPIAIADMTCGMYSAMGILAALYAREKTGRGQYLDMALLDSQLTWLANVGSSYLNAKASPKRWGNAHPSIVPYEVFRGSDGRSFVVGVGTEALWKKFVRMMRIENGVGQDEKFRTNALRTKNRVDLIPLLQKMFDGQAANVWLELLAAAQIPAAPINSVEEAVNDAQTLARNMIVQLEHPALGMARSIGNPIKFSETPVSYRLPPPLLGEHTSEVLRELGYSEEEARDISAATN